MRWVNTSSPPVMLDLQQAQRIAMHLEEYESNDLQQVFCELGHHPWGQPVVVFMFEDLGEELCEAYWLLDDGSLQYVTPEEHKEAEALVDDIIRRAEA